MSSSVPAPERNAENLDDELNYNYPPAGVTYMSVELVLDSPISAVSAVGIAAKTDLSKEELSDAYDLLKQRVHRRYRCGIELASAISEVEERPGSAEDVKVLRERSEYAALGIDEEIVEASKDLLQMLNGNASGTLLLQAAYGSAVAQSSEASSARVQLARACDGRL